MGLPIKNESNCNVYHIIFKYDGNKLKKVTAKEGETLLEVAHKNEIPLEGACEGSLACSTCHVYCDNKIKNFLCKDIKEKENDLLDRAYNVKENSRLGCQIKVNEMLNNKIFEIPRATINLAVDGYVPKPH
ncbi:Adrenodoxin [Ecytonucleospora hepatopenaei]|uniref:Adrenodoxin n=1 Tax=Ecytonucleospora hepatopenaei TaxID=646526 RepID=A0A1W0E7K9_9MICR|nr:Adrenodoxin [Ecytonucleospora hepatopenaei]